ncbi:MAG: pyridoxamine 5'-phosphate oxidase family protein [Rhodospirillaceae bacterium]|nr:pyridoxamine 5'-phosphate oxidase family protein [Rhodospirillaceae bacterium]
MPDDIQRDNGAPDYLIRTEDELRALIGPLDPIAVSKTIMRLDPHCRQFISLSPFLCIGTFDADGRADVSPRGAAPGFVQVIDDRTIAIPDRPGNNRLDTMTNILANPSVGLLFFVPGFEDTLRINGKARLTNDPVLMAAGTVNNRPPKMMIRVDVEEAFLHCAKALKRSKLWDPTVQVDRKIMPSLARMILEQIEHNRCADEEFLADVDREIEHDYKQNLY